MPPVPAPDAYQNDKSHDRIALVLCIGSFFVWLCILINKFFYFGYYDWDLALYANAMWNLSHGSFYSSLFGTNFLTNHAEYFSFFLAPLYRIFGHPFLLIVLKPFSIIAGSFVLYLIAKKELSPPIAMLLMLLYQMYPPNFFMLIYEFHFENLAPFFIFLLYYFFTNQRLRSFLITAFFASMIKENIALIVATFGLYAIFTKREKKFAWVLGPLLLGGGSFVLSMFVITPYLRMKANLGTNQYIGLYWPSLDQSASLTEGALANLRRVWNNVSGPVNIAFIKELFGPLNFLSFLSPHVLFLGAPVILQNFLSPAMQMHTIYYHYAATITVFVFLALVPTFKFFKTHFNVLTFYAAVVLTMIPCVLNIGYHMPEFKGRMAAWEDRLDLVRWEMVHAVPPDTSIIATFDFLDKLSSRKGLYSLHSLWRNSNPFSGEYPYRLPKDLSMALIDWGCPWLWGDIDLLDTVPMKEMLQRLSDFYFKETWSTQAAVEEIVILKKGPGAVPVLPPLVTVSEDSTHDTEGGSFLSVDDQFVLSNFSVAPSDATTTTIPFTFVWKAKQNMDDLYGMVIKLRKDGKTVFHWRHHVGYGIYATPLWKKGQYIKEHYRLLLPAGFPAGDYTFAISLVNMSKRKDAQITFNNETGDTVSLLKFRKRPNKIQDDE